jgi:hypothetical protein
MKRPNAIQLQPTEAEKAPWAKNRGGPERTAFYDLVYKRASEPQE